MVFPHFNSVHCRPEHRVVVFDAPPVFGQSGTRQVTAVLLQDTQGLDQTTQGIHDLRGKTEHRLYETFLGPYTFLIYRSHKKGMYVLKKRLD